MNIDTVIDFKPKMSINQYIFGTSDDKFFSSTQIKDSVDDVLNKIPRVVTNLVVNQGYKIIVTNTQNLEEKYHIDYEVLSMADYDAKEILVYATPLAISTLPHEIGHIIDNSLNQISCTQDWLKLCDEYKSRIEAVVKNATRNYAYFTSTDPTEFFCDCFLTYVMRMDLLSAEFPTIVPVFDRIIQVLKYDDALTVQEGYSYG